MKTLTVNGYAMPYLDFGQGQPLVCIHGSMSDFRTWSAVMGPLSQNNRLIIPSLRHFFPDRCEGQPATYRMAQHVEDAIAFLEGLALGPVDLIGHSRGGHISFRLASRRPELIRKLVLAEPGGSVDGSLMPKAVDGKKPAEWSPAHVIKASELIAAGDLEGGLRTFADGVNGAGTWDKLPLADRQMRKDNAGTLLAQTQEGREPYTRAQAEALSVPTLFVGGGDTVGGLPVVLHALAGAVPGAEKVIIPSAKHSMFKDQPQAFCDAVLDFLGR